jgi:DNA-binding transcriptional regulator YdaS (Cro superfamily)
MEHPIDKASRVMGSRAELARRLNVTKAAVGQWREPDRRVPAEHCPVIEQLTAERGERVPCEDLRPDVAWHVLRAGADIPPIPQTATTAPQAVAAN